MSGLHLWVIGIPDRPSGNVKTVRSWNDLNGADLSDFNALDFEGPDPIALGGTGMLAFKVPANIKYVFLGPGAWVQGKLRFEPRLEPFAAFQADPTRSLYGPGVRFAVWEEAIGAQLAA